MTLLPALAWLPWLGALAVLALPARAGRRAAALAGAVALAVTGLVLAAAPAVFAGEVLRWRIEWLPALGLDLALRLDGLAWLFALLIGGIGALVVLYAAWYLDPADPASPLPRFLGLLLGFMGAMLGIVLAGDLLLLVVFWELTSLSSFLLIGYWHRERDARQGARMALTVTGAGGLALLAGVLLLGHIVGSLDLDAVLAAGPTIRAHPLYGTALVLVLVGAFAKSAQFPLHFWLPRAMAAPTPVSAYLHSATLVKAGVFLLVRLHPALGGSEAWFWIVTLTGLATLVAGAYIAIFQHDLKGLLAYSTISHLGLIVLLLGLDTPLAIVAALFHVINHATFKAGLFMSAGIIDHECGTRDLRRINGLMRLMPITATLGMVAAAAMAGVPLLNGFLSKEMFFAETLALEAHAPMQWLLPLAATVAGMLTVAYSTRFVHDTFFNGQPRGLPRQPHEPPFFMRLPVLLLVLLCIAVGLAPQATVGPLLAVAARAALHGAPLPAYELALWHGLNGPLAMSAVAITAGVALYFVLQRAVDLHRIVRLPGWAAGGGPEAFALLHDAGLAGARALTGALHSGRLQRYLLVLVLFALAAAAWPLLHRGASFGLPPVSLEGLEPGAALVGAVGIAAALATTLAHRQRLLALVLLGATGLVVCLAFVWFSAPDLALTQLLVEVVTIVLMMLALRRLPATGAPEPRRWPAWRDAAIAVAAGLGLAALAWSVLNLPSMSISEYFLQTALPLGGGANVVNVILVDYRGFDTLGEITVLMIAALVVHALLAGRGARTAAPAPAPDAPLLLQEVARLMLPLALLISLHLLLRGHNEPGGGFVAALVLTIAVVLQQLAHGPRPGHARPPPDPRAWMAVGIGLAAATGLASWLFGAPFLTSTYDYPWLPGVGGVPLASAALFDLGVYAVVAAACLGMLFAVARVQEGVR